MTALAVDSMQGF